MGLDLSSVDPAAQNALIAMRAQGQSIQYQGFVKFYWPEPIGPKTYAVAPYNDPFFFPESAASLPSIFSDLDVRLIANSVGGGSTPGDAYLQNFALPADARDSTVQVMLSNVDGKIEDAFLATGWGVPVEIFVWLPQQNILKSLWLGYTNPPQSITGKTIQFSATYGFRSGLRTLPGTLYAPRCFNDFPPEYPNLFPTIGSIVGNRCPFDQHLGGSHGIGGGGATCNRLLDGCISHFGNITNLPYTGMDAIQVLNGLPSQSGRSGTLNQSKGNNSALSNAIRVIGGERWVKNCDIVQMTVQINVDHPERGSVTLTCIVCEGHVLSVDQPSINDVPVDAPQFQFRLGDVQQTATGFIPQVPTSNFSSRVVVTVVQKGAFAGVAASNFNVTVHVHGLDRLRIYTTPTAFTLGYSTNPAWFILSSYYDRMWGQGIDIDARLNIQDWIDLAAFYDATVSAVDASNNHVTITRSVWNGEWQGRRVPDQLRDAFLYRSTSMPFIFEGRVRAVPITKDDLADAPVFSDRFLNDDGTPNMRMNNILPDASGLSTSDYGEIPIDKQPTEIDARFDDAALDQMAERPLTLEDLPAEVRAGKNAGDNTIIRTKADHSFTAVTNYGEAVRVANKIIDLGEFDQGGLVNPITWTFKTTLLDALRLHPYKIIKQDSYKLDKMKAKYGFEYFRIISMEQEGLIVSITAQAYPVDYYIAREDSTVPLPRKGTSPLIGGGGVGGGGGTGGGTGGPFRTPFLPLISNPAITLDRISFDLGL